MVNVCGGMEREYSRQIRRQMWAIHQDAASVLAQIRGISRQDLRGTRLIDEEMKYLSLIVRGNPSIRERFFSAINNIEDCDRLALLEKYRLLKMYEESNAGSIPKSRGNPLKGLRALGGNLQKGIDYALLVEEVIVKDLVQR